LQVQLHGADGQIIALAILGEAFAIRQLPGNEDIGVGRLSRYVLRFAFGLGPVFWLIISEIYSLAVRGTAMSAATVAN
jgi:SP family galactose:H+ symporter-like MFS transporter